MKILFANIGWMKYYQGKQDYDKIHLGGHYPNERKHETFNFMPINGRYYGFVWPNGKMSIQDIDKDCEDATDRVENVLVIWTATHPQNGGRHIVGWYKNATVYREFKESKFVKSDNNRYNIRANVKNSTLVPPSNRDRDFAVPHGSGFFGRSHIWYPNKYMHIPEVKKYIARVLDYIENYKEDTAKAEEKARQAEAQEKKRVEKKAVKMVTKYYENQGYTVVSVEKDNIGWDLNAYNGDESLKLEVKGRSSDEVDVMITRNEYQNMKRYRKNYRLCVVTGALTSPELSIFYWNGKLKKWVKEKDDSIILNLEAFDYNATIRYK